MYQILIAIVFVMVVGSIIVRLTRKNKEEEPSQRKPPRYAYSRRKAFITNSEKEFYKILQEVAGDRYYIFPQIHLSSLFQNETYGRYHKAGFQIINRRSIDYVLCDKETLEPAYAVELDDATHDTVSRIKRDDEVNRLFEASDLPLVRFRNYRNLTKEEIATKFFEAHNSQKT